MTAAVNSLLPRGSVIRRPIYFGFRIVMPPPTATGNPVKM